MSRRVAVSIPPVLDPSLLQDPDLRHKAAQWPMFAVTVADMNPDTTPRPISLGDRLKRTAQRNSRRSLVAAGKGIFIAVLVVGIVFGILPLQDWWLSAWHWVAGLLLFGGMWLLFGMDAAIVAGTSVAMIQFAHNLPSDIRPVLKVVAAVVVGRVLWEWALIARRR